MEKEGGKYVVTADLYEIPAEMDEASGAPYPSPTQGAHLVQTDCRLFIDPESTIHAYKSDQLTQTEYGLEWEVITYTLEEAFEENKTLYYHDKTTGNVNKMGTLQDNDLWLFVEPIDVTTKAWVRIDAALDYEKEYIK